MATLAFVLLVAAFAAFLVETVRARSLVALGLACWVLSLLLRR